MCFYFCTSYLSEKEYEPSFNLSYMYKQEEISYYWISSKKMCSEETILSDSKSDPLLVCYHLFQKRKKCMYYVGSRELGNQVNDLPQTGRSILADVYILSDLVLFSVSNCIVYLKMTKKAANENHLNKILFSVLIVASELHQAAVSLLLLYSISHNPP